MLYLLNYAIIRNTVLPLKFDRMIVKTIVFKRKPYVTAGVFYQNIKLKPAVIPIFIFVIDYAPAWRNDAFTPCGKINLGL